MDDRELRVLLNNAFDTIECDQAMKNTTLNKILENKAPKCKRAFANINPSFSPLMKGMAAVVCFIVTFVTAFGVYTTPAAAVCIEGDLSIRMEVNRFNKVLKVVPYNDKAKAALENIDSTGTDGKELLDKIVNSNIDESNTKSSVEVAVVSNNEKLLNDIASTVKNKNTANTMVTSTSEKKDVVCQVIPGSIKDDAEKNNMTYQRYELYKEILKLGIDISKEQAQVMSVEELRMIIASANTPSNNGQIDHGIIDNENNSGYPNEGELPDQIETEEPNNQEDIESSDENVSIDGQEEINMTEEQSIY